MNTNTIIEEIKTKLTGDPKKDGPFLKSQSDKYANEENSDEINRELAKLLYQSAYDDMNNTVHAYLSVENKKVNEKIKSVYKRFKNLNYGGGIEILREIIKDNLFAWIDDDEFTCKSFGTPIEHALYLQIYQSEKEIKPVSCNLSEVYTLYGWGLTKKQKFTEAIEAYKRAIELNPTDAEIYASYCELLKVIKQVDELRTATDKLMQCAVTKEQLSKGYFNYSYYFSEKGEFDKAVAMLEMSRIFYNNKELIKNEMEYISKSLGLGSVPAEHTQAQLMKILEDEAIQPGPSILVVDTAYFLAKRNHQELNYELAKYFYEVVWELIENDDVEDIIAELDRTIKDAKTFSSNS